ncbi:uncharacterized protein LOC115245469 isoform X2 [Formica exsecta]|uniref:uncharacterized protein LOC115245469 isoform X2 n=2 Tax=Formica exsecta TaxID=72781 RepID=UPI001143DCE1|nr:uncharacterized protein LOC115245469 isoform X2 [Formica exsecta]XP_029679660.1 uncharacterized protein LOC115245469 isoform X2 [Formica exsecta]
MARSMASLYDGHDHYKRMFELREKLRKSEEERIRLEGRFNELVRESYDRHDACINRLRMRYIQYLEEQRARDERNHKLLAALDKVTNKLALISAKKDRLNVLRKQYEAYLLRVYANRRQPGSVTGDSGIASQNEDKYTKKIVTLAQPDIASAETRSVSSPRAHLSTQSNQPRSTSTFKLHDQTAVNGTLLNNSPILPTTPLSAPFGVDYHQTRVPREPHVYVSPVGQSNEQLTQVSAISSPNTRHYPRTLSGYDESASRGLQDVGNFRASHTKASVLPMSFLDQIQPDAVPVNRFFREHVESLQAATSGLSTQFPAGKARYEETSRNEPVSRRFDPLTALQCDDVNIMLSNPQSQIREYDPSDVAGPSLMTAKSSTYRVDPNISVVDEVDPLPGYMDYIEASPQKSEDEGSIHSLTSDDVDDMIRRNEHLLWSTDGAKTPCRSPIDVLGLHNANLDENGKTTAILENELDQYISKIRKLHREHGVTTLEEMDHEQNTSGDLLNVTLSEDAAELPAEDRARKERVSAKMDRILALANDLASKTTGLKEVTQNTTGQSGNDNLSAEVVKDEIRHREATTDDTSQFEEKREPEGRGISAKNEIREDVATHSTELEQTRRNAEIAKESWNNADDLAESRERDREIPAAKKDDTHEKIAASSSNGSQIDNRNNASEKKQFDLVTGEESNIDGLFDVAEELTPWNLASMQKEVRELDLSDPNEARAVKKDVEETENKIVDEIASESHVSLPFIEKSGANDEVENAHHLQDTLPHEEMESKKLDVCEASESQETHHPSVENVEDVTFEISNQHKTDESKITSHVNEELGESKKNNDKKQDNDETTKPQIDDRSENIIKDNEYSVEQEYVEDSSQEPRYEQDSNEQYRYDQGISYEGVNNEEYERYAAQGYAQEGQEYVEYVDGQYEQYPEDPNNPQYQHDPNAQYEQDPNQAYDYNYDPNQGYGDDPNQQYDPNQGYENNSGNQAYDYTEQVSYDPNQVYDNTYEQEEQHNPDNNVVVENPEKEPETEETSQRQANPESEHKSSRDEDPQSRDEDPQSRDEDPQSRDEEPQQVDAVSGTKKKDVIKSLLDSDTDTTIERNVSNTESDFDFN